MFEELFAKSGLSLERLKTFAELVEAHGFTAAAKGDPTKQSQFSRQLREVEEFFGVELVTRGRGKFALTSAGRELYRLVRSNFGALEDLRRGCANQLIEISLGAGESLLQWLVLPRLARVRKELPGVVWVLQNLQTEEIVARLSDGRTDLGILRRDAMPKSLRSVALGTLEYALVVPRNFDVTGSGSAPDKLLSQLPLAVMEGHSKLTEILEGIASKAGTRLNVQLRCSSFTQVAEAVRQLGLAAVLPIFAVKPVASPEIEVLPLPFLKVLARPLVFAWNPRQAAIRPMLQRASKELAPLLMW